MAVSLEQEEMARALRRTMEKSGAVVAQKGNADDVINALPLFPAWRPAQYAIGNVCRYMGEPYRCTQAHDSTDNPLWTPSAEKSLWGNYHGTTPETALPWVAPTGAHDQYRAGEYAIWTDGQIYRAKRDTVFSPAEVGTDWEVIL